MIVVIAIVIPFAYYFVAMSHCFPRVHIGNTAMDHVEKYTPEERYDIYSHAKGPGGREEAISAHRAMMARVRVGRKRLPYGDIYFEFMREVDCPMPDLGLRSTYRRRITAGER